MIHRSTIETRPRTSLWDRPWGSLVSIWHRIVGVFVRRSQTVARSRPFSQELSEVLDCFSEGFLIIDSRLKILFANAAILEIFDSPGRRIEGRSIDSLRWYNCLAHQRPWHRTRRISDVAKSGVTQDDGSGGEQLIGFERDDRSRRLLAITVRDLNCLTISGAMVISVRDATGVETYRAEMENLLARVRRSREEVQESNEELQQLVVQDALTGCRNRRCLDENADTLWETCRQERTNLACMMFDIDHFKSVNDQHGHATGDEVLRQFGQSLREAFAGVGQVYRYGGEEFCVLLPGHDLSKACWIADRVRTSVSQLVITSALTRQPLRITVSIGVTDQSAGADDASGMIDQADKCLYLAKRQGRNRVIGYGPEVATAKFRTSDR